MAEPSRLMSFHGMFSALFQGDTEVQNIAPEEDICVGFLECARESFGALLETKEELDEVNFVKEIAFDPALSQALMLMHLIVVCMLAKGTAFNAISRIWTFAGNFNLFGKGNVKGNTNLQEGLSQLNATLIGINQELKHEIEERDRQINKISTDLDTLKAATDPHPKATDTSTDVSVRTSQCSAIDTPTSQQSQISIATTTTTASNVTNRSDSSLPKTATRIPIFKDSPKPITPSKIRRCNGSYVTISLADIQKFNYHDRAGPASRIPLFKNSPRPLNVTH